MAKIPDDTLFIITVWGQAIQVEMAKFGQVNKLSGGPLAKSVDFMYNITRFAVQRGILEVYPSG